jgi:hypothetical protein
MTHAPNLTSDRFDQLRTFLVAEAVADTTASHRRTGLASHRRRVAVGAVAAVLLGGGLAVSTLAPGGTDAALAITTEGDWTMVSLVDVHADAQAVVDELVAADIDARLVSAEEGFNPPRGYPSPAAVAWDVLSMDQRDFGLAILFPAVPPEDTFEPAGVRMPEEGDDWTFSIRSDSDVSILVWDD